MYERFAAEQGWRFELVSANASDIGGFKEGGANIQGSGGFAKLKFESGVHRVQRVPVTEANGRIHTSTVTVAVLPEAEEVDVELKPEDLDISVCRASGPGGQNVNKVATAVELRFEDLSAGSDGEFWNALMNPGAAPDRRCWGQESQPSGG